MTYRLKKNARKSEIEKILREISVEKKGLDMSRFAGKIKSFNKVEDVVAWQRRQRDDGTYNY